MIRIVALALFLSFAFNAQCGTAQRQASVHRRNPSTPQPAVETILGAFSKFDVVAMPAGHRRKDVDDLILMLIRDPRFARKVNAIAVECGNALYQPVIDQYIADENVPFDQVKDAWRNTTQTNCGTWGFYEQLFPLVRAINHNLPAESRLRIIAADPPVDWESIQTKKDAINTVQGREQYIATTMEEQVLSKGRKALMLFGDLHLLHNSSGPGASAVSLYEKNYPNRTFVIAGLGLYGEADEKTSKRMEPWAFPSIVMTHGTVIGALTPDNFFLPSLSTDSQCAVHEGFFDIAIEKPIETYVDALLYVGPADLNLKEPIPADIALDTAYVTEMQRREALMDIPGPKTVDEFDRLQTKQAGSIFDAVPKFDLKQMYPAMQKRCMDRKNGPATPN